MRNAILKNKYLLLCFVVWTATFLRIGFEVQNFDPPHIRPMGFPFMYIYTATGYVAFLILVCLTIFEWQKIGEILVLCSYTMCFSFIITPIVYFILFFLKENLTEELQISLAQVLRTCSTPFLVILSNKIQFGVLFCFIFSVFLKKKVGKQ